MTGIRRCQRIGGNNKLIWQESGVMGMEIQDELEKPFDASQIKKREGKYEYLEIQDVIQRLNMVLGYDGWEFAVVEREKTDKELIVFGELRVRGEHGIISKMQCGRKKIIFPKGSDVPLDLGNDWKSAIGDCIKKCATLFGVGLYLTDEATDSFNDFSDYNRPIPKEEQPQKPKQASRPQTASASQASDDVDEIGTMKNEALGLEKKVLIMTGESQMTLRERLLNSRALPSTANALLDYTTKLNDLLEEGVNG